MTEDSKSK